MNYILINFPFSSIDDEPYVLSIYAPGTSDALLALRDDSQSFKFVSVEIDGSDVISTYEGSLVGDVTSEDDSREDIFAPLVASKLKFSVLCQRFPSWLMDLCNYYTNVKVILCARNGATNIERWRGYLMANTLNMTVVDDLMACPLVAVDEVGISKYLKFKENYSYGNASPTLFELFKSYRHLNMTSGFTGLYGLVNAVKGQTLIMSRNMRLKDDANTEVIDLLGLVINLEKYFLDRDATWATVLQDVCEYLNVSFCIGSIGSGGNDLYILSGPEYDFHEYMTYNLASSGFTRTQSRAFGDFGNQFKVGADLQLTYKPDEWKGVKVRSTPERPPVHAYLDNGNVKAIEPAPFHGEWCETRIGKVRDANERYTINDYKYRVFQYAEIVDKEDQWIPERLYLTMYGCEVSRDSVIVGYDKGYFPLDPDIDRTRPGGVDTDSMDFALSKIGMIPAKIGTYETLRQKISPDLKNYFVILNNKWGRLYWNDDHVVNGDEDNRPYLLATFTPFAEDTSLRPSCRSYLSIDMTAMFLNENIGENIRIVDNGVIKDDLLGYMQAVFPILDSDHNWECGPEPEGALSIAWYTGDLTATSRNIVHSYYPYVTARLSIGNHYWDGSDWQYQSSPNDAPFFNLPLIPESVEKYWMVNTGYLHKNVLNYYYVDCHPRMGASENVFRVPLAGLSKDDRPLQGEVKLELWGRIPFFNAWQNGALGDEKNNNILFMLLSDIMIGFTDEAYYADENIKVVAEVEKDPDSTTKKVLDVELGLSTPKVEGVFNNCLLFDDGSNWVNLSHVHRDGGDDTTPEEIKAGEMADVLCGKQEFAEFSRRFRGLTADNIYNVGFTVRGLTETMGIYMPLERKFNWTKGTVRWKLQRVANGGRSFNASFNHSYNV